MTVAVKPHRNGRAHLGLANDAHERFAQEYLVDLNATAAYQRAYPDSSEKSARTDGPRLLANAGIAARVAELQAERARRVQVRLDDVLRELMVIAFSDVRHFTVDDGGKLELTAGAPDQAWRAVSSVKHRITVNKNGDVYRDIEYRLWSKTAALELLKEHIGAQGDAGDEDGVIPFATLRKAMQRAARRAG